MPGKIVADFVAQLSASDSLSPALGRAAQAIRDLKRAIEEGVPRRGSEVRRSLAQAARAAAADIRALGPAAVAAARVFEPLTKELGAAARGVRTLARDVRSFQRGVGNELRRIGQIMPPIAGLAALGSIGGVVEITSNAARLGAGVRRNAMAIGISPRDLQLYHGAGEYVGLGRDQTASSLASIGQHLHEASYGRDLLAINALSAFHLGNARNADGSVRSVASFLPDLLRAASQQKDPFVQKEMLGAFGADALLPLAQRGPDGIAELMKQVEQTGGVLDDDALTKADRLNDALIGLGQAARGAGIAIGVQLMPEIERLTTWLAKPANREWAGAKIEHFLTWLRGIDLSRIESILLQIGDVIGAGQGPGQRSPSAIAPGASRSTSSSGSVSAAEMYDYAAKRGASPELAAGMVASILSESRGHPDIIGDGGTSGGLFQDHDDRFASLVQAVPDWRTNWKGQIDHAFDEMRQNPGWRPDDVSTPYSAGRGFSLNFERPAGGDAEADARGQLAERIYREQRQRLAAPAVASPATSTAAPSLSSGLPDIRTLGAPGQPHGFDYIFGKHLPRPVVDDHGNIVKYGIDPRQGEADKIIADWKAAHDPGAASSVPDETHRAIDGGKRSDAGDDDPSHQVGIRVVGAPRGTRAGIVSGRGPAGVALEVQYA